VDSDEKCSTLGRSGSPRKDRIFLPSQRSGHPEAVVAIPAAQDAPVAACGAEAPRIAVPGTAANDPQTAITVIFRRAVRRRPLIALSIAVLDPLPDVPMHLIEPPRVRSETVNRHGLFSILALLAAVVGYGPVIVRPARRDRRAPPERRRQKASFSINSSRAAAVLCSCARRCQRRFQHCRYADR
jgi:hypothetical protein